MQVVCLQAGLELELVGADRLGFVGKLTKMLAERGISIRSIHTDIVCSGVSGKQTFKVETHLLVLANLSVEALRKVLGALASEMMLDIAFGER
ncbi:hypothetical protein [Polaromonas aquatica]|uniref:hypothetical protein n=1 Tax=Polaromonas aquatica TaxID=332657 RepID=UPI003D64D6D5